MDGTYAPQSPDLSSFLSSKPQPPPQQTYPSQTRDDHFQPLHSSAQSYQPTSYAPRSPTLPFDQPPLPQHHQYTTSERSFPEYTDANTSQYLPPGHAHPFSAPTSSPYYPQPIKSEPSYYPSAAGYNPTGSMPPRGSRVKDEPSDLSAPPAPTKPPPPSVDIRTKFPVARIKRIMQADEEVGKVAQVTPVAVNKALELFMTALVLGAAERAKEKGGKRITAGHLKSVVEADEQFDFLNEIVGRVQEAAEGERKRKGGKETDSEDENSGERKVKKGKGRRKKSDD